VQKSHKRPALGLSPTASTTAALALGDALALCVLERREFTAEDFARSHPGGSLGRKLLTRVKDIMRVGNALPVVSEDVLVNQALNVMTEKGLGFAAIVNAAFQPIGIFTDGDLRRAFVNNVPANATISTGDEAFPKTIMADQMAVEAVEMMEKFKINALMVTNSRHAGWCSICMIYSKQR
jgi:arabinose-5-phosphate isomerase